MRISSLQAHANKKKEKWIPCVARNHNFVIEVSSFYFFSPSTWFQWKAPARLPSTNDLFLNEASSLLSGGSRIIQIYYKIILQRGSWCTACLWHHKVTLFHLNLPKLHTKNASVMFEDSLLICVKPGSKFGHCMVICVCIYSCSLRLYFVRQGKWSSGYYSCWIYIFGKFC